MKTILVLISIFIFSGSCFAAALEKLPSVRTQPTPTTVGQCSDYVNSAEIQDIREYLFKVKSISSPMWDQYRIEKHTLVFTDSRAYSNCALVFDQGSVSIVEVETPIKILNGIYGFYFAPVFVDVPKALKEKLETLSATQALIYNTDPVMLDDYLGKPSEFEKHLKGYHSLPHHIITHEGFHIFTQFSKWYGTPNYDWPDWDIQPDRSALVSLCYQAASVKEIFLKEHKTLLAAFKLIFIFGEPHLGKAAGKEFLRLRASRYQLLVGTKVPTPHNPDGIPCAQAEAIMELEEGLADFVGNGTRYLLGELSPMQIAEGLATPRDSTFYDFGFLQMMAVYGLKKHEIGNVTSRIANSSDWVNSIGKEFFDTIQ